LPNDEGEEMIKQEVSEAPEVKTEPSGGEFIKLLADITKLNLEWLNLQVQKLS
jgi:hypothetical protein